MPVNQRFIQQPAPLQIRDETRNGLIDFRRVASVIVNDAVVGIPGVHILVHHRAIPKLNHAHAALNQPSGHQALAAERPVVF